MNLRSLVVLLAALVLAAGCSSKPKADAMKTVTPGNGTPPNPVYLCDGVTGACNVLGNAGNPLVTTGTGGGGSSVVSGTVGAYQADGGGIANSWAVQVNDGTNVLGTTAHPVISAGPGTAGTASTAVATVQGISGGTSLPTDPTPGDLLSTVVHFTVATASGSLPDAGTFVAANVCNEGTLTAWWQIYFGQLAVDAGGTADAGTAPSLLPLRLPAGACGSLTEPQPITGGAAVWYSSSTQGLLTVDAGVQNMAVDVVRR